jgi:hypothetical protein
MIDTHEPKQAGQPMSPKKIRNLLDFTSGFGDATSIKPAAPLHVCAIRRVFFCPDCTQNGGVR